VRHQLNNQLALRQWRLERSPRTPNSDVNLGRGHIPIPFAIIPFYAINIKGMPCGETLLSFKCCPPLNAE
jgi:hypothetical protein